MRSLFEVGIHTEAFIIIIIMIVTIIILIAIVEHFFPKLSLWIPPIHQLLNTQKILRAIPIHLIMQVILLFPQMPNNHQHVSEWQPHIFFYSEHNE